jgi:hypothetical protein
MMSYLPNSRRRRRYSKNKKRISCSPRMKNLSNSAFIRKVFAIFTSYILIYFMFKNVVSFLEILSLGDYQEETNAPYIIPQLCKKHYMEAIEELGGRLKYRLHNT